MPKYKKNVGDARLKHIVVPGIPKTVAAPAPLVQRLVDRLRAAFSFFKKPKEPSLIGRIHELDSHAGDYQHMLNMIKKEFSLEEDPETYIFIEAIIDPLLKEIARIQNNLHSGTITQQAKTFKAYGEWIERAKVWVLFYEKTHTKQQIIEAVVHHLVGETLNRIDRDLQVIEEYRSYHLQTLPLNAEKFSALNKELSHYLQPHLDQLMSLKKRPSQLTLEQLSNWKGLIDSHRQSYFEHALHIVDVLIERESPSIASYEATEYQHEVISEISYLEREAYELVEEIKHLPPDDYRVRDLLFTHLIALEEQTHLLHLDMRLGWDLFGRLQKITAVLEQGRSLLGAN